MCLSVRKTHPNVFVAQHNILCWKALKVPVHHDAPYLSPWRNTPYQFGIKYEVPVLGFYGEESHYRVGTVHAGLHAFTTTKAAREFCNLFEKYFPAIVPVGTEFYFDKKDEELAAKSMIVFKNMRDLYAAMGVDHISDRVKLPKHTTN